MVVRPQLAIFLGHGFGQPGLSHVLIAIVLHIGQQGLIAGYFQPFIVKLLENRDTLACRQLFGAVVVQAIALIQSNDQPTLRHAPFPIAVNHVIGHIVRFGNAVMQQIGE